MSQMHIYIDGVCRGDPYPNAIGAASALLILNGKVGETHVQRLPQLSIPPTTSRAELTAMTLALRTALSQQNSLPVNINHQIKIFTNSIYAIGCLTNGGDIWKRNGWVDMYGQPIIDKVMILEAVGLRDLVNELVGKVEFVLVRRDEGGDVERAVEKELDMMQREQESWYPRVGIQDFKPLA